MHHGDGGAPVPLPGYQPVPELRAGEMASDLLLSCLLGNGVERLPSGEARELQEDKRAFNLESN